MIFINIVTSFIISIGVSSSLHTAGFVRGGLLDLSIRLSLSHGSDSISKTFNAVKNTLKEMREDRLMQLITTLNYKMALCLPSTIVVMAYITYNKDFS